VTTQLQLINIIITPQNATTSGRSSLLAHHVAPLLPDPVSVTLAFGNCESDGSRTEVYHVYDFLRTPTSSPTKRTFSNSSQALTAEILHTDHVPNAT